MKRRSIIILGAALLTLAFLNARKFSEAFQKSKDTVSQVASDAPPAAAARATPAAADPRTQDFSHGAAATTAAAAPRPTDPLVSLAEMAKTLHEFVQPGKSLEQLLDHLNATGQQPVLIRNSNESVGETSIVRTKSPFPGTRYFYAHYNVDENGHRFVKHMSFEFKPGPTALVDAVKAVRVAFPGLKKRPDKEYKDFISWKLEGGHELWIRRMSKQNVEDGHPYNAYTPEDVGTIQLAVELAPHGEDEH